MVTDSVSRAARLAKSLETFGSARASLLGSAACSEANSCPVEFAAFVLTDSLV